MSGGSSNISKSQTHREVGREIMDFERNGQAAWKQPGRLFMDPLSEAFNEKPMW